MKILIMRGAKGIGDLLFTTPLPRLLSTAGHEVSVAAWPENEIVYQGNPYVKEIVQCPDMSQESAFAAWFDEVNTRFDRIINLGFTVEKAFLHRTDGFFGPIPDLAARRRAAAGKNYYEATLEAAGIPASPVLPELYPTPAEIGHIKRIKTEKEKYGFKLVIWNFHGSTRNKTLSRGPTWLHEVMTKCLHSQHFVVGSQPTIPEALIGKRCLDFGGSWSLRTSMIMTSVADVVVGPESAIINAAGAFDCHKVVLYSHSSPENLGKHWHNHHPITPKCKCSPCYLIPVNFRTLYHPHTRDLALSYETGCLEQNAVNIFRYNGFKCVTSLPDKKIIETILSLL